MLHPPGLFHLGNDAQQGHAKLRLQLVGMLDRIVHVLAQEHQAQGQHQAHGQTDHRIRVHVGLERKKRRLGLVHQRDVVGGHAAGHAHLLQALQQVVVDLAVGVELALEQAQVHALVLRLDHLLAGLLQARAHQVFLAPGRVVLRLHRRQHGGNLGLDAQFQLGDLRLGLQHLGEIGFVGAQVHQVLGLQLRLLLLDGLHGLVVQHLGGVLRAALHLAVLRLCLHALLLSL